MSELGYVNFQYTIIEQDRIYFISVSTSAQIAIIGIPGDEYSVGYVDPLSESLHYTTEYPRYS